MDIPMVLAEARAFAARVAQMIGDEANKKAKDETGTFAGVAASMVLQNITTAMMMATHSPGDPAADEKIRAIYASAAQDAVDRWHKSDLKEMRARGLI